MKRIGWKWTVAVLVLAILAIAWTQIPGIAAGAILYPYRVRMIDTPPAGCEEVTFAGDGVRLSGWRCAATAPVRGTVIMLHGIAGHRVAVTSAAPRFTRLGFDVIAYDSRAHGNSEGRVCTYGYYEKHDLRRVIDTVANTPIVLLGTSLGAAVALQEAADDPRVATVISAEVFSDLRTVVTERSPVPLPRSVIDRAFALAEQHGQFQVEAVDVVAAARRMTRPVLLIHGSQDRHTYPAHSQRVYDGLRGPKRLMLIEGAAHNQSLSGSEVWIEIEKWAIQPPSTGSM